MKDLIDIKKLSSENDKSQIESVFELNLTDEEKILDLLTKEQSLETVDLSSYEVTDDIKSVLPTNYININFIAPFKVDDKTLHIAIPDSSKLSLMRNLKTITKKEIELHGAKVSQISEFIQKIEADGEVTSSSIQQNNQEKVKTFDYDVDESAELLSEAPEEDIEAIENESDVIKFSTAVVAEAIQTVLRREGYPKPYEALKGLTRKNEAITKETVHAFVDTLEVSDALKIELREITPQNYTGIQLVR